MARRPVLQCARRRDVGDIDGGSQMMRLWQRLRRPFRIHLGRPRAPTWPASSSCRAFFLAFSARRREGARDDDPGARRRSPPGGHAHRGRWRISATAPQLRRLLSRSGSLSFTQPAADDGRAGERGDGQLACRQRGDPRAENALAGADCLRRPAEVRLTQRAQVLALTRSWARPFREWHDPFWRRLRSASPASATTRRCACALARRRRLALPVRARPGFARTPRLSVGGRRRSRRAAVDRRRPVG